jgi:hypothetical protein
LVAPFQKRAVDVVRQEFLVAIDANQVLQRARDAGFDVRLHLRQVDDDVRLEDRAADQVFIRLPVMMRVHQPVVVVGHAEPLVPVIEIGQQALPVELDQGIALFGPVPRALKRVAAEHLFQCPLFEHRLPQIDQAELDAGVLPAKRVQ